MSEKTFSKVKLHPLFLVPSALSQLYFVVVERLAVSRQTLLLLVRGGLTGQLLGHQAYAMELRLWLRAYVFMCHLMHSRTLRRRDG
jgi:hypothetical protein